MDGIEHHPEETANSGDPLRSPKSSTYEGALSFVSVFKRIAVVRHGSRQQPTAGCLTARLAVAAPISAGCRFRCFRCSLYNL